MALIPVDPERKSKYPTASVISYNHGRKDMAEIVPLIPARPHKKQQTSESPYQPLEEVMTQMPRGSAFLHT